MKKLLLSLAFLASATFASQAEEILVADLSESPVISTGWSGTNLLGANATEIKEAGTQPGDTLRFYMTGDEGWIGQICTSWWKKLAEFRASDLTDGYCSLFVNKDVYNKIIEQANDDCTFILNGDKNATVTKVTLSKCVGEYVEEEQPEVDYGVLPQDTLTLTDGHQVFVEFVAAGEPLPNTKPCANWGWYQHNTASQEDKNIENYDYVIFMFRKLELGCIVKFFGTSWDAADYDGEISTGSTLFAIPTNDIKSDSILSMVLQPKGEGIVDLAAVAYVTEAEYAAFKAADDAKERYMEKAADWTVELTDNDASSWETKGWFGDENLNTLYKTAVVEVGSSTGVTRICFQTLPDYKVHEYFVAPTQEPVKVTFPITEVNSGIGQIAVCNRNITKFLVNYNTGLLKEWTEAMTVVVNKIYYTSNEVESTYTAVEEPKGNWINFDNAEATQEKFTSVLAGFELTKVDTDSKMVIDSNEVRFGIENDTIAANAIKVATRLKTGGKSSAKNSLTLSIPTDGVLTIGVRTGKNEATDRTMVVSQNGTELFNEPIVEGMKVTFADKEGESVSAYPMIHMPVKAGTVEVTYPVGAMNFYTFGFGNGYLGAESSIDAIESVATSSKGTFNLAGQRVNEAKGLVIRNGKLMLIK